MNYEYVGCSKCGWAHKYLTRNCVPIVFSIELKSSSEKKLVIEYVDSSFKHFNKYYLEGTRPDSTFGEASSR